SSDAGAGIETMTAKNRMRNALYVGFSIFLCLSAGYTSARLLAPAIGLEWSALIGLVVFAFAMLFLDNLQLRPPLSTRAGTSEAEQQTDRPQQQTALFPPDHPIVKQQNTDTRPENQNSHRKD